MQWDPTQYGAFAGPRFRPALDLIARIPDIPAREIVDLGCGPGTITALLAKRWAEASVTGLDSSDTMLARAQGDHPPETFAKLKWVQSDIAAWSPDRRLDVIFSNAALHWLPDHDALFPRLLSALAPGGVLAVQMPRNFDAPSHHLMREVAESTRFAGRIDLKPSPVQAPSWYDDCLSGAAKTLGEITLDLWETEYLHRLEGEDAVLNWVRGTALLPVFAALAGTEREAYLADYGARLREAYPRRSDGITLFPFRRLFIVARRG